MPDVFSKKKRSWVMSRIRGKDTKPEAYVEKVLQEWEVIFEKHPKIFGRPDFVVREAKLAVFTDGDFWHGYRMGPRRLSKMSDFWRRKIAGNKTRDRRVNARLRKEGWTVVRIWEHEIENNPEAVASRLKKLLESSGSA
jgi:DNA mismatch endonuclease (patch repair protein)